MIDLEELPSTNFIDRTTDVAPSTEGNIKGIGDAFVTALEGTLPFVQEIKYPIDDEHITASDEEIIDFYNNEFPTLDKITQDSIQGNGGFRNRQQVNAIINRVADDQKIQQDLYEYGGVAGSIGLYGAASLINPADWFIALSTFGVGKAVTSLKAINKVMNQYKKTSSIALGAVEGGIAGYASETFRQETQGIEDEDARFNTFLFGTALGGTLGAKGWFDFFNQHTPTQQQSILNAIEADTTQFNNQINEVTENLHNQSIGSAGFTGTRQNIDIDDINDVPTPSVTQMSKWFSPRAWLYSSKLPSIYKSVSKLVNSNDALKDSEGNFVVQSERTAFDYKREFEGVKGTTVNKLMETYNKYNLELKNSGQKKLNETEFSRFMYDARLEATKQVREHKTKIEVLEGIKEKTPQQEAELASLKASQPEINYSSNASREINETFNEYYKYMEDNLRRPKIEKELTQIRQQLDELPVGDVNDATRAALERKKTELEGWSPSEYTGYLTRIFDKDRIQSNTNVVATLTRALQNSPTAKAMREYLPRAEYNAKMNELAEVAAKMAAKIQDAKDLNQLRDLVGSDGAGGANIVSGGFATGRRIDVDETLLDDLVHKDMSEVLDFYHTDMSGKLSIRKAFKDDDIDTWQDYKDKYLENLSEEYRVSGKSREEIDRTNAALQTVFEDIRGTREITSRPNSWGQIAKKVTTSLNNVRFGPNFSIVALNEIGPTMHMGGVKTLGFFKQSISASIKKITNKQLADDFINELNGMGIGADIQNSKAMLRYTEGTQFFESNKVINGLRKAENAVFRYGGLVAMTDAMKSMLAGGFTSRVINIASKRARGESLSTAENAMLSRVGLDDEMLAKIKANMDRYGEFDNKGYIKKFNIDDWEQDVGDRFADVLHRITKGNILEPTAMDIPMLMSDPDKPLHSILLQYYKFPIAAQSQLLSKAINDRDIGALGASMVSGITTALVEYGKVSAGAKLAELLGIEYENPYDDIYNDTEQMQLLAAKTFSMNPFLGIYPTAYNIAAPALGMPIPGTTYTPTSIYGAIGGPTVNTVDQMVRAIAEPDRLPGTIFSLVPRVPGYDLGKNYIKEEF